MVSVTAVSSGKAVEGVKVAVLPLTFQDPAVEGEILGSGELEDSGAEKPTVMAAAPLTLLALELGETDVTSRAGAGVMVCVGFGAALDEAVLCREEATDVVRTGAWPGPIATTTRPAMSTSAAAMPVISRDLLARERPVPLCDVRRRNQSEYDTPSPRSLDQKLG
jgi:hypothetical protein